MKQAVLTVVGVIGGMLASLLGGWDTGIVTLLICMGIDYLTGLLVAGVFHQSRKSRGGALESLAGWKGLCKKGMSLLIVVIAVRLDLTVGSSFIRDAVVIAFIVNETISIIENAGLMGVPVPNAVMQAVDVLNARNEKESVKHGNE